jgi:hypothetical protein
MSYLHRRVLTAAMLALGLALGACSGGGDFDPSTIPDAIFGTGKKPLPGDRRAVFPEGVPGVTQGVPPELMKGHQEVEDTPIAEPAAEPAKPTKSAVAQPAKSKPKKKVSTPSQPTAAAPTARPPSGQSAAAPWPDAAPTPAPQSAWPPPNPNTFSR